MPARVVLILLVGLLVGGCQAAPTPVDRPLVLTSVTVLADLIRQVGGDQVEVRALVPSGADPYTYQPAARDVLAIARAAIVFYNGFELDRSVRASMLNAARRDLPVVTLAENLPTIQSSLTSLDPAVAASGRRDNPYLWLDPRRAAVYVERIRDGLSAIDPAGRDSYGGRARAFLERLGQLDDEVARQLDLIPADRRKLVTLHDGFPYLAERYHLQLVAVAIKTPGRAPSAREVADLSRAMRLERVRTVFTEPQLDARLLKLAARDEGLQIGTLYSDTLDQTVPSYEALLRYNARQLVSGLK